MHYIDRIHLVCFVIKYGHFPVLQTIMTDMDSKELKLGLLGCEHCQYYCLATVVRLCTDLMIRPEEMTLEASHFLCISLNSISYRAYLE